MSMDLDIDDAVADHPKAKRELLELREEVERLNDIRRQAFKLIAETMSVVISQEWEIERLRGLLREKRDILLASAVIGAGDLIDRIDAALPAEEK
jgi:hypothetical protein